MNSFIHPSVSGASILFFAGMLSSLSPCCLSMIPITSLYLSSRSVQTNVDSLIDNDVLLNNITNIVQISTLAQNKTIKSLLYAAGLAFTFTVFGAIASYSGQLYNIDESVGGIANLFTAIFAFSMGLNLLEILNVNLPTLSNINSIKNKLNVSPLLEPFLVGVTAAFVLSPCSSPVLASLLAIVSKSQNPTLGSLYLFLFSLGYSLPTVLAVNTSINVVQGSSASFQWVNTIFGCLLVMYGTYSILDVSSKFFEI
jgi:cytochrome c-type biogenesis protein